MFAGPRWRADASYSCHANLMRCLRFFFLFFLLYSMISLSFSRHVELVGHNRQSPVYAAPKLGSWLENTAGGVHLGAFAYVPPGFRANSLGSRCWISVQGVMFSLCECVRACACERACAPVCMRLCPYWCFEMQSRWGHNLVHYVLWFAAVAPGLWHRALCHLLPTGFLMRVCDLDASSLTTVSFPLFTSVFSILITLFIAFARRNLLYWRGGGGWKKKKRLRTLEC